MAGAVDAMQCPFCAEEIQDAAILCRFCGSRKIDGQWVTADAATKRPGGELTIKIAAVFFMLSALFELSAITSPIPLFGDVRTGAIAGLYHLAYIGLFATMGAGLWLAKVWGPKVIYGGTIAYSLDRLLYIADDAARKAEIAHHTKGYEDILGMVDTNMISSMANIVTLTVVLCWWGFAAYIYWRRSYFIQA